MHNFICGSVWCRLQYSEFTFAKGSYDIGVKALEYA